MRSGTAAIASLLLFAGFCQSQILSLDQAVSEALDRHPLLAAGRAELAASQGLVDQAGKWAFNPKLVAQTENARLPGNTPYEFWDATDNFLYLQQTFETGGRRKFRTSLAQTESRIASLQLDLLQRQLVRDVRLAYWTAVTARQQVRLLEETLQNHRQAVEYHRVRVREGVMAEADLIRVQLELNRVEIARQQAALAAQRATILLEQAMGRERPGQAQIADTLPPTALPLTSPDVPEAISSHPALQLAETQVERARARSLLEQAHARPNFDLLGGLKRTSGFNTVIAGLQFDLPVLNRNQGSIAWAEQRIRAAQASAAAQEALLAAEAQAAYEEVKLRRSQIEATLPALAAQARETVEIARAAYREGGTDLLRLLDAERVQLEVQQSLTALLGEYHQSLARLAYAVGAQP